MSADCSSSSTPSNTLGSTKYQRQQTVVQWLSKSCWNDYENLSSKSLYCLFLFWLDWTIALYLNSLNCNLHSSIYTVASTTNSAMEKMCYTWVQTLHYSKEYWFCCFPTIELIRSNHFYREGLACETISVSVISEWWNWYYNSNKCTN